VTLYYVCMVSTACLVCLVGTDMPVPASLVLQLKH
jgi:hypothetical protein